MRNVAYSLTLYNYYLPQFTIKHSSCIIATIWLSNRIIHLLIYVVSAFTNTKPVAIVSLGIDAV